MVLNAKLPHLLLLASCLFLQTPAQAMQSPEMDDASSTTVSSAPKETALVECLSCTPFKKEPFGIIETSHVKVVLNFNQYYLGREVLVVKIDETDTVITSHYPDMEYVDENRPLISQEVRDVLYATNNGRRDWLKADGYNVPEPFNVLMGNNLAFAEQQPGKEPNLHAHLHSIMRYKAPITIAYKENGADVVDIHLLDPRKDLPEGFKALRFVDTEFGHCFLFDKKLSQEEYDQLPQAEKEGLVATNHRNRKLPPEIMMWMADEIAKYSTPYITAKGHSFVTRKDVASKN